VRGIISQPLFSEDARWNAERQPAEWWRRIRHWRLHRRKVVWSTCWAVADRALDPEAVQGKFAPDSLLEQAGFEL
jgi:hypothetical protein